MEETFTPRELSYAEKINREKERFFQSIKDSLKNNGQILRQLNKFKRHSSVHYQHTEEVALLTNRVAVKLTLSSEDIDKLTLAAFLHDIGKLYISAKILHKDSSLSDDEFAEIKKHVDYGRKILIAARIDPEIMGIALRHHEFKKEDGRSYPRSDSHKYSAQDQKTEKLARILAMVDSIQAAADHNRSYNKNKSQAEDESEKINYADIQESVKKELNLQPGDDSILNTIAEAMQNSKKYNDKKTASKLPENYHLQFKNEEYFKGLAD
jgi:putative nucleotidyltransferase with HDIG domain